MSRSGCPSYQHWITQSDKWLQAVNFGSVITAWTPRMLELSILYKGNHNICWQIEKTMRKNERANES